MRVLGLYNGHDSSAAVIENGQVIVALEEERLTGIKKISGFPARSVFYICKALNCSPWDFDKVMIATPSLHWGRPHARDNRQFALYPDAILVPHHEAHAALAYSWSGWNECTVMTCDGGGDEYFATINYCKDGKMNRFFSCKKNDNEALGMLYFYVTECLGFTPNRHEGKVMGLAAHGKSNGVFDGLFWVDGPMIRSCGKREDFIIHERLKEKADGMFLQDVAASCQKHFEEVLIEWVLKYAKGKLAVAGGCFANVLCNMKISKDVESFYVAPPMMDCGLSVGAALCAFDPIPVHRQEHMYLGLRQNPRSGGQYSAKDVAKMVESGKIVGLFQGYMEFGPRALGNRTILADARDQRINAVLNKRLHRTEFMPFAPVILEEYANDILIDYEKGIDNAPFMTNCWEVRDEWKWRIPAVVHIDGTARPQVLKRDINPYYYDIVKEYMYLTGIPVLINTSMNGHENPIVCFNGEADWLVHTEQIDIVVEA